MGEKKGAAIPFKSGDAVVIPAGVGHKKLSSDFTVLGAYPGGVQYDMKTGKPNEREEAVKQIKQAALPPNDPITGKREPLLEIWVK